MSPRRAKVPRGRAESDPATAWREHLIDAAQSLLAERQATTITTRDIARAAGVSDGVLYNYFTDKNDLLITALVRRFSQLVGRFSGQMPACGQGSVSANLAQYAVAALDLLTQTLPVAAGLMNEPQLLHAFLTAIHTEPHGPEEFQKPIVEYVQGEQALGRMGAVDPEVAFTILFGPIVMLALSIVVGNRPREDALTAIPSLVDALVNGLVHGLDEEHPIMG